MFSVKQNNRGMVHAATHWSAWAGWFYREIRVETKLLMTPAKTTLGSGLSVQLDANTLEVCIDFLIMSGLFISAKSFPSLSQLAFGLGNTVDPHLPAGGFIPLKESDREGEVRMEMREREQGMDNSVLGGYGREVLADMSIAKASRGGLEAEGLPERDTVVWMIEWGTMPTHSPQPFINENTGLLLHRASAKEGCRFLFSLWVFYVSVYVYHLISPWGGAITALPWRLGNVVQIMACLRGLQLNLSLSQKALALGAGRARWTFCMIAASSFPSSLSYSSPLNKKIVPYEPKWTTEYIRTVTLHATSVCVFKCQKLATCHNCQFTSWNEKSVQSKWDKKIVLSVKFNLTSRFLLVGGLLPCPPPTAEQCIIAFVWNTCYIPLAISDFLPCNWLLTYALSSYIFMRVHAVVSALSSSLSSLIGIPLYSFSWWVV